MTGLEGALRRAVEGVVVFAATALLFPSRMRWAGKRFGKLGMYRLRTIQVSALHQYLRLSSRDSKEEVKRTCQIGISAS